MLAARSGDKKINIFVTTSASVRLDSRFTRQSKFARATVHYFNNEEQVERFYDFLWNAVDLAAEQATAPILISVCYPPD